MPHHPESIAPGHSGIEIHLDSPDLVLRSITGNEEDGQPALLKGEVELVLAESTHMKDVTLVLRAGAKIDVADAMMNKRQHADHPLFFHDISFLSLPAASSSSHEHTFAAGHHKFPFQVSLPTTLPASLRTFSGSALVYYKLKAIGTKACGFLHHGKWEAKRLLRVATSFVPDAVEWSQTMEIENTWPGKISYEVTLPHKAYAAGQNIPINLKFSPLVKGIRVASITTVLKEHVQLQVKSGATVNESRDAAIFKHEFVKALGSDGRAEAVVQPNGYSRTAGFVPDNSGTSRNGSSSDIGTFHARLSPPPSPGVVGAGPVASGSGHATPLLRPYNSRNPSSADLIGHYSPQHPSPSLASSAELLHPPYTNSGSSRGAAYFGETESGEVLSEETMNEIAQDVELCENIDTVINVPIPIWTTPTNSSFPIQVTHKLKWSVYIKNVDGHTSELRCALPIHILASHLSEEVRLATSGIRSLLFGASGALVANSELQATDLPSYQEHVRDRLASLVDMTSIYPIPSGMVQAPWSSGAGVATTTGLESMLSTPMHSPPSSRPSSPGPGVMASLTSAAEAVTAGQESYVATQPSRSGAMTPAYGFASHDGTRVSWTSGAGEHDTSTGVGQTTSQSSSNPGSQPTSRPPSGRSSPAPAASHQTDPHVVSTLNGGVGASLLRHLPKPLRTLTPMNKSTTTTIHTNASTSSGSAAPPPVVVAAGHQVALHAHSATLQARLAGLALARRESGVVDHQHVTSHDVCDTSSLTSRNAAMNQTLSNERELLSRVPSYRMASRGPLGGGQVPLSSLVGLPSYNDSERSLHNLTTSIHTSTDHHGSNTTTPHPTL